MPRHITTFSQQVWNPVLDPKTLQRGGAVTFVPIPDAASYDYDDFETAGQFSVRALWTDALGAAAPANYEAISGYAHNKTLYGGGTSASAPTLFGADRGADFELTANYEMTTRGETADGPTYNENYQRMVFWWQDANNYIEVVLNRGNNRIGIQGKMAAATVAVSYFNAPAMPSTGALTIQARSGVFRMRLNGVWLMPALGTFFPYDAVDYTAKVAVGSRKGKVGFWAGTYRWAFLNDFAAKAQDVSIEFNDGFVGRDSLSATGGTTTLEINTYGNTASRYIGRVLNYTTRAVVQDWTDLGASADTATMGGVRKTIFLPTGGPYIVEAGYVGADGLRHTSLSRRILSGRRIVFYGQSNSANKAGEVTTTLAGQIASMMTLGGSYTNIAPAYSPADSGVASTREWAQLDGPYRPNFAIETARVVAAALGQPVGVQVLGRSGVGIDYLTTGTGWTDFVGGLAYGKGVVEALVWDQGEGDADGGVLPSTYATKFATLVTNLRSQTGNPNLPVFISMVGRYAATAPLSGTAAQIDACREVLRQQFVAAVAADPTRVFLSSDKLGLVHADAYHYTGTSYQELCRRDGLSIAKQLFGLGVSGGFGPNPTGMTLSGDRLTLTVAVDLDGATGLTNITNVATGTVPTPTLSGGLYGYQVSADNFATLLPISTIVVDRTTVPKLVVTLSSAAPVGTIKLRSMYGWSYDDTNLFYGIRADGNIPIRPIITPLSAT